MCLLSHYELFGFNEVQLHVVVQAPTSINKSDRLRLVSEEIFNPGTGGRGDLKVVSLVVQRLDLKSAKGKKASVQRKTYYYIRTTDGKERKFGFLAEKYKNK